MTAPQARTAATDLAINGARYRVAIRYDDGIEVAVSALRGDIEPTVLGRACLENEQTPNDQVMRLTCTLLCQLAEREIIPKQVPYDLLDRLAEPPDALRVFYARRNDEGRMYDPRHDGGWPLDAQHYVHAANVYHTDTGLDVDALEHCWRATNSTDEVWWSRDDDVERIIDFPDARSMCVGDVVVLPNGNAYRCAPAGWTQI